MCDQWVPPYIASVVKLKDRLTDACRNEPASISNGTTDTGLDLGFTFTGNGATEQRVLIEIARRFRPDCPGPSARVPVISLGAGQGLIEWKMLVAGGNVHSIEQIKGLASMCAKNAEIAQPFLRSGENLASLYHVYKTDIMGKHVGTLHNQYEVAYAGNLLHMLHPKQVAPFFKRLHNMLVPGGDAFLSCQAPSGDNGRTSGIQVQSNETSAYDLFQQRNQRNEAFPGHMAIVQRCDELRLPIADSEAIPGITNRTYRELCPHERDTLPHQVVAQTEWHITRRNVCGADDFKDSKLMQTLLSFNAMTKDELRETTTGDVWESEMTRVLHHFDRPLVVKLARAAGFDVIDSCYTDNRNRRFPKVDPSPDEFRTQYLACFVHLRKPLATSSSSASSSSPSPPQPPGGPSFASVASSCTSASAASAASAAATAATAGGSEVAKLQLAELQLDCDEAMPNKDVCIIELLLQKIQEPPPLLNLSLEEKAYATRSREALKRLGPFQRNERHVCTTQCTPDRSMPMVLEAIKSVIPSEKPFAKALRFDLSELQLRMSVAGYGTPEQQALFPNMAKILNKHVCDGEPFQSVLRDIIDGKLDYRPLLPRLSMLDTIPGSADLGDEAEQRRNLHAHFRRMPVDELALYLPHVPASILAERLAATARERCPYYNGMYVLYQ